MNATRLRAAHWSVASPLNTEIVCVFRFFYFQQSEEFTHFISTQLLFGKFSIEIEPNAVSIAKNERYTNLPWRWIVATATKRKFSLSPQIIIKSNNNNNQR